MPFASGIGTRPPRCHQRSYFKTQPMARQCMECGGKRSATPLWLNLRTRHHQTPGTDRHPLWRSFPKAFRYRQVTPKSCAVFPVEPKRCRRSFLTLPPHSMHLPRLAGSMRGQCLLVGTLSTDPIEVVEDVGAFVGMRGGLDGVFFRIRGSRSVLSPARLRAEAAGEDLFPVGEDPPELAADEEGVGEGS